VGTALERLRVPLSTWVGAAHAFSYDLRALTPLKDLQAEIGVSHRTVLRMRDMIKRATREYRGFQTDFGAWPRSFMRRGRIRNSRWVKRKLLAEGKHPSQNTISSAGLLTGSKEQRTTTAALRRTVSLRLGPPCEVSLSAV
jgi:hypothetical protein